MYKISSEDIAVTAFSLGRRFPTSKYMPIAIRLCYLAEYFSEEPPKGLCPMAYHTMDYETELKYHKELRDIVEKYGKVV